ncbi:hypothetical protein TNCV_1390841, partial [Trichonephila clavipes]
CPGVPTEALGLGPADQCLKTFLIRMTLEMASHSSSSFHNCLREDLNSRHQDSVSLHDESLMASVLDRTTPDADTRL